MTAPTPKYVRVALYARISPTPEGKAGENYSIASQLHEMRAMALKEFGCAKPDEYIDKNQMGGTLDRPALDRLRDHVAAKLFDVIIAYSPDRWSRNPDDKFILKRELAKGSAKIVYVVVQYDDSAEGELSEGVQDVVSRYEKRKFAERSRRCRRQKSREGYPHACLPPDGYEYQGHKFGKRGEWVVVPERAKIVRLIFERTAAGVSASKLAQWLNAQGIPTLKGKRWLPAGVAQLLRKHHSYTGTVIQNGETIKVPVIIPQELWDKARSAVERHRLGKGREPRHYLLSGILWCKLCGKRCVTLPQHGDREAYRCGHSNPHNRAERYCNAAQICKKVLEPVIWDAVWDTVCDAGLLWEMIEAYYDRVAGNKGKTAKDPAVAQIERARRAVAHAERIFRDPEQVLPYETRKADLEKAKRELAEAETRGPASVFVMPLRKDVTAAAAEFRKMRLELKEFEDRRDALKLLVSRIVYADREAEIHCRMTSKTARKSNQRECSNFIFGGAIPFVINCKIPEPPPVKRTTLGRYLPKTRVA